MTRKNRPAEFLRWFVHEGDGPPESGPWHQPCEVALLGRRARKLFKMGAFRRTRPRLRQVQWLAVGPAVNQANRLGRPPCLDSFVSTACGAPPEGFGVVLLGVLKYGGSYKGEEGAWRTHCLN